MRTKRKYTRTAPKDAPFLKIEYKILCKMSKILRKILQKFYTVIFRKTLEIRRVTVYNITCVTARGRIVE